MTSPPTSSRRSPAHTSYRAELDQNIARVLGKGLPDGEPLAAAVVALGAALRQGISLPRQIVSNAMLAKSLPTLLGDAVADLETWPVGDAISATQEEGRRRLLRRDELASLVVVARRVCFQRDDERLPELDRLVAALRVVDDSLRSVVAPAQIAELLGDHGLDDHWYRDFCGEDAGPKAGRPEDRSVIEGAFDVGPSGVVAYIVAGLARRTVESWAAASEEATDDLATAIDTALATYEPVCFVARLWRRAHGRASGLLELRSVTLAASDDAVRGHEQHTLGSFAPIEAEGSLDVSGRSVVLRVFAEHVGAVTRVRLGDREASEPAPGQPFVVEHPRLVGLDSLRVRIAGGGLEIDEILPLTRP